MKVRIKGNSIRYRLTKSEVAEFCANGKITTWTDFNEHALYYTLMSDESCAEMTVALDNHIIVVRIPESYRNEWKKEDKIGFQHTMLLDNGKEMLILIEKDFVCLDERDEDESDNYPNPKANN